MARLFLLVVVVFAVAMPGFAETLKVDGDAPSWQHMGAALLLYLHIGGGTLGLVSGTVAVLSPKGRPVHRAAGKVFFISMFIAYAVGAGVAPFLETGQRPNFVAGVLALYLLVTAWLAATRRDPVVGAIEYGGLAIALSVVVAGTYFMLQGMSNPSGTIDDSPPQAFVLFIVTGLLAAGGELHVILRRKITGVSRISRHLWRMCLSLFIASGSFFLGQQQILPEAVRGTLWQFGPLIFPLAAAVLWLVIEHLPKKVRT